MYTHSLSIHRPSLLLLLLYFYRVCPSKSNLSLFLRGPPSNSRQLNPVWEGNVSPKHTHTHTGHQLIHTWRLNLRIVIYHGSTLHAVLPLPIISMIIRIIAKFLCPPCQHCLHYTFGLNQLWRLALISLWIHSSIALSDDKSTTDLTSSPRNYSCAGRAEAEQGLQPFQ